MHYTFIFFHHCCRPSTWVKVKDGLESGSTVLLAMGYGNDEPHTVTSSTRHVIVEYLVTSSSDVSGGLMASYVTLGTIQHCSNTLYTVFRYYLTLSISETVRDRDIVTAEY